jgi:hypothetical protein
MSTEMTSSSVELNKKLLQASINQNIEEIKKLLKEGATLSAVDNRFYFIKIKK